MMVGEAENMHMSQLICTYTIIGALKTTKSTAIDLNVKIAGVPDCSIREY